MRVLLMYKDKTIYYDILAPHSSPLYHYTSYSSYPNDCSYTIYNSNTFDAAAVDFESSNTLVRMYCQQID